jgi:hypothetical protein
VLSVVGMEGVRAKVAAFEKLGSRAFFESVGAYVAQALRRRTLAGRDVEGRLFAPYGRSWRAFREAHGRPGSRVDLCFTGAMLGALSWGATAEDVRVYFLPTADARGASSAEKAHALNRRRQFFGLSENERAEIVRMLLEYVEKSC